jgi:hypothetical protein
MMKMEKARRIIEVVVKGSPVSSCMRRTMIAGLLLAASANVRVELAGEAGLAAKDTNPITAAGHRYKSKGHFNDR